MQKQTKIIVLTFFICSLLASKGFCLSVPIHLRETKGFDRVSEPVTAGIPMPQGKFFADKNNGQPPFKINDAEGRNIPSQFKIISFYKDKSIRWLLADFQATVKANTEAVYYLKDQGSGNLGEGVLTVKEDENEVFVNTGTMSFLVTANGFNVFDELTLFSEEKYGEHEIISSSDDAGLMLTDTGKKDFFSSLGEVESIKIEEKGPMRVVILLRGNLAAEDKDVFKQGRARYSCRITAYRGKSFVKVSVTLENLGKYGFRHEDSQSEAYHFKEFSFNLPLNMKAKKHIMTEEYDDDYSNMEKFSLFQYHQIKDRKKESKNFAYVIKKEAQEEERGFRDPGWVDINDSSFGVTAFVRHYWQNFPKETSFLNNTLSLGLWPEGGKWPPTLAEELRDKYRKTTKTRAGELKLEADEAIKEEEEEENTIDKVGEDKRKPIRDKRGSYRFRGGLRKTYDTFFRFYHGNYDKDKAKNFAGSLAFPLIPHCEGKWYSESGSLFFFSERGWKTDDLLLREAMKRYEKLQDCKVHIEESEYQRGKEVPPSTIYTEREKRGEKEGWYGWMDFGDLAWGGNKWEGGYCSLHYDWTYGIILQFLRSGDPAFFYLGDEMARHRMDIDQYYSPRGSPWLSGFQWNEFGKHDRIDDDPWEPLPSHTWIQGLLLYYMITGNVQSLEAALQAGEATRYYWTHTFDDKTEPGDEEIRIQGWSIENLISLYEVTGEEKYLSLAHNIYKYRTKPFIRREGYSGSSNYINVFWILLASEPLAKLYEKTKDSDILDTVLKMINFITFKAYQGGVFDQDKFYKQLYLPYHYNLRTKIPYDPYPPYNFMASNIIAYGYLKTGNPVFQSFSRRVFRDAVNYWQEDPDYNFPNKLSPITYAAVHFPGSRTKVHGFTNRYPLMYLYMEKYPKKDTVLPSMIKDIELSSYKTGEMTLDWTSPQDDSRKEAVSKYIIRHSTKPILSENDWLSALRVENNIKPALPGEVESFRINNIIPQRKYFVAIKSIDEAGNYSQTSNSPSIKPKGTFERLSKRDGGVGYINFGAIYDGTVTGEGKNINIKTLGKILGVGKKGKKTRRTLIYFQLDKKKLKKVKHAVLKLFCSARSLPPPKITVKEVPPNFFYTPDRPANLEPVNKAVSRKVKKGSVKSLFRSLASLTGLSKSFPKSFAKKEKAKKTKKQKTIKGKGKAVDTSTPWVRKRWYEWDVTPIVKNWEKDNKARYFLLENINTNGWSVFVSNESTNVLRRPILEISTD